MAKTLGNINAGYGNTLGTGTTKSSILGGESNNITGGTHSSISGGLGNVIGTGSTKSFIGGGVGNSTFGIGSAIVGGNGNSTDSFNTFIGGGGSNNITLTVKVDEPSHAAIVGGQSNTIEDSKFSMLGGGSSNSINDDSYLSFIGGGTTNKIHSSSRRSVICGGQLNTISGSSTDGVIIGGDSNSITKNIHSFIGGGDTNIIEEPNFASTKRNVIVGGKGNRLTSTYASSIVGGQDNLISGDPSSSNFTSSIVGGFGNKIYSAEFNFIGEGEANILSGNSHSNIIGGFQNNMTNTTNGFANVIGGGIGNSFDGGGINSSTIVGGGYNTINTGVYAGVTGGYGNTVNNDYGIALGARNTVSSDNGVIIGGKLNTIGTGSTYSSILGGQNNIISGHTHSHIIGSNITSVSANTTHVEKLNIKTLNTGTTAVSSLGLDINGMVVSVTDATTASNGLTKTGDNITLGGTLTGDTNIDLSGSIITFEGESLRLLSDATELVEFAMAAGLAGGGIGFRGFSDISFPNYGKQGDMFIRSGADSNGLSIISYPGTGTDDSIRFFAGDPLGASGIPNIHIQGSGSTIGYVGIGTDTPLAKHHVEIAAIPGDEIIQLWSISDSLNGLRVINGTTASNTFLPTLIASSVDNDNIGMFYTTQITIDTGVNPVTVFDSRLPAAIVAVRPLFSWDSFGTSYMTMSANGDLGIGTTTPNTKLDINGGYATRGKAGTIPITATTDDWDFGDSSYIRAEPLVSNQLITGIANGVDGKRVVIMNNSATFDLTFTYNDASSTINNRLLNNTASTNLIVGPNKCVEYIYDVNDNRWRQIGGTAF